MKNIISFVGAPGCGKGYLIDRFIDESVENNKISRNRIAIISIGEIIRDEIKKQTALGRKIKSSKKDSCMAPNSLITPLLQKSIYQTKADLIILDGYPRSLEQLDIIKSIIPKNKLSFVFRDTPEQIIKERIKNRRICSDCGMSHISSEGACCCGGKLIRRHDDLLIDDRLNEYRIVTIPMIEKLKESFSIYTFQGSNVDEAKLKAFVNMFYADNKNNICSVIKINEGK